jgi:hypothetical protein
LFNISLIMFTYITFPYYLFKTRGLVKGLLSIIRIILFIVLFFVVMLIGASLIIMTQGEV